MASEKRSLTSNRIQPLLDSIFASHCLNSRFPSNPARIRLKPEKVATKNPRQKAKPLINFLAAKLEIRIKNSLRICGILNGGTGVYAPLLSFLNGSTEEFIREDVERGLNGEFHTTYP
jgi:hypothetical protein